MKVVTTYSDTIEPELYDEVVGFVNQITELSNEKNPAISNMGLDNESGLLYNIKNKIRWTKALGQISFLKDDDGTIVGVSCVESTKYPLIAIGGIRTWVLKEYRLKNVVSQVLLDSNLKWAETNGMAGMMLTFNNYNKWIYDGIRRKVRGKSPGVGSIWSDWWNDCIAIDRPLRVRYVSQWCVVKPTGLHDIPTLRTVIEDLNDFS